MGQRLQNSHSDSSKLAMAITPGTVGGENNTVSPPSVPGVKALVSLLESDDHFRPSSRISFFTNYPALNALPIPQVGQVAAAALGVPTATQQVAYDPSKVKFKTITFPYIPPKAVKPCWKCCLYMQIRGAVAAQGLSEGRLSGGLPYGGYR